MNLLPKWVLPPTMPSVYESESFTALEMVAKVYGAMNELITEYNKFVDSVNKKIETFTAETKEQQELFALDLRQEFQDFIDIISLTVTNQTQALEGVLNNMEEYARQKINEAFASGKIQVTVNYNPETESLDLVAGGEV